MARRHGLLFVEDCAQAFRGRSFTGHPDADVSMFSFGTIKTATALGGALLSVRRRPEMLTRMRRIQALYPVQSRARYFQRILKYIGLKGLSYRTTFRALVAFLRLAGRDFDRVLNNSIRGFPAEELLPQLRQQACAPLLRMLHRRLRIFDESRQARASQRGQGLANSLSSVYGCPASTASPHVFWVFPVLTDFPGSVLARLRREGFDATQGQSLVAIEAPFGREGISPPVAKSIVDRLLFLPFYEALPDRELDRMALVLTERCDETVNAVLKPSLLSTSSHQGTARPRQERRFPASQSQSPPAESRARTS